jgi:hypothetical protein
MAALAPVLCGQAPGPSAASPPAPQTELKRASIPAPSVVVREIDDPSSGKRWLLVRDGSSPGGPGRLLLANSSASVRLRAAPERQPSAQSPPPSTPAFAAPALAAPVIRPNDALIVEETTPIVEARLTATALGAASVGALLMARLEIGGKVVRVRALAPGHATLDLGLNPGQAPEPAPKTGDAP